MPKCKHVVSTGVSETIHNNVQRHFARRTNAHQRWPPIALCRRTIFNNVIYAEHCLKFVEICEFQEILKFVKFEFSIYGLQRTKV